MMGIGGAGLLVMGGACGTRVVPSGPDAEEGDGGPNVRGKLGDDGGIVDLVPVADAAIDTGAPDRGTDMTTRQCTPPDKRCDGKAPQTCDTNGLWQGATPCLYLCVAGACTGSCTPGDVACTGGAPELCDATGSWKVGAVCPAACNNGACVGRCVPNARQCSGTVRQVCDATGQWRDDLTCPFVCIGTDCAGVCSPGTMQCLAGDLETCSAAGSWQSVGTATRELLANPGFEAGVTGWTSSVAGGFPIIYFANAAGVGGSGNPEIAAQSAPNLAWLGGYNRANDVLTQVVAVPANAASAMLSFYYAIFTDETSGAENDVMDVQLMAGNQPILQIHLSDNDAVATWTHVAAPLPSNVAGQTLTLQFHAVTNGGTLITSFYVDTVSLQVVACP
jgi:hypothetical protein